MEFLTVHHQKGPYENESCPQKHPQGYGFFNENPAENHGKHDGQTLDGQEDADATAFEAEKIESPGHGKNNAGNTDGQPGLPAHVANLREHPSEKCCSRKGNKQYRVGHCTCNVCIGIFNADFRQNGGHPDTKGGNQRKNINQPRFWIHVASMDHLFDFYIAFQ